VGRLLNFPKGSIVAIDKGYNDYTWYNALTNKEYLLLLALKVMPSTVLFVADLS